MDAAHQTFEEVGRRVSGGGIDGGGQEVLKGGGLLLGNFQLHCFQSFGNVKYMRIGWFLVIN